MRSHPRRAGRNRCRGLLLLGSAPALRHLRRPRVLTLLDRRLEDVAERGARVGGAVLRHRLLLLGDLQRLDGDGDAARGLVDAGDGGIDLVADVEALGSLLGAVAREVRALDEGRQLAVADLDLEPVLLDRDDRAGHRVALLEARDRVDRIAGKLLDAERDALLLAVDVEHDRFDGIALLEVLDRLVAGARPVEVGQVHHAVDAAIEADEEAELGDVADRAFDGGALRMRGEEALPGVLLGLLEAERDAALVGIDLEHLHLDLLARRDDLAGVHVLLGPAHLGDVDQAFDARLQLHEGAVVGDVRHGALDARADRILGLDRLPRIGLKLLHAERDALRLRVDADDLHLHRVADIEDLGGVVDAAPGHVGDVQQAVDAAEIDEGAVVGDVLDETVDHLALLEAGDDVGALLGARLFQDGAARDDDVAAAAVHLEDLEGLRLVHQRADVAHGADVDLAAGKEGHGAVEIDREAALDLVEDDARDLLVLLEHLLEPGPALLAPRLVARQHGLAQRVLDALEVNLDLVADLEVRRLAGDRELAQRHAAFHLEADVDDGEILLDADDLALDHAAFEQVLLGEAFGEQRGKLVARGAEVL